MGRKRTDLRKSEEGIFTYYYYIYYRLGKNVSQQESNQWEWDGALVMQRLECSTGGPRLKAVEPNIPVVN